MRKLGRSIKRGNLRKVLYLVLFCFSFFALLPRVEATPVASDQTQLNRSEDLAKIKSVLERKEVQSRLESMGMSKTEVEKRLALLSDEDIHKLATNLDQIQPGEGALETILILLVIAGLVILILWLAGVIDFDRAKKEKPKE